jgi:CTP synthase (UTP-ammonia lyase)
MKLAIIGDYDPANPTHTATEAAIRHAGQEIEVDVIVHWLPTEAAADWLPTLSSIYDACWIAPGSPYKSMEGALRAIGFARINGFPTLGTCGGFQHMAIEFARHVLGLADAAHAEYDPYASRLVVKPLSCSLVGKKLVVQIRNTPSRVWEACQKDSLEEQYYCNFGLDPAYQDAIDAAGFKVVSTDADGEARILELENHPFYVATLFLPQASSTPEHPHPLIRAFLRAAQVFADQKVSPLTNVP